MTIGLLVALAAPAAGSAAALRGNGVIAFDRHRSGNWDIYVKAATRSARAFRLTTNRAADFAPAFSPGGTRIAFSSNRGHNYDIYTISTSGHQLRRITSNIAQDAFPTWSPDGRRIAFTSNRSGSFDVWVLTVASGNLRRLTTDSKAEFQPAWSPNGSRILFTRATAAGQTIDEMPVGGGPVTMLTGLRGNEIPRWQPVSATTVTGVSPGQGPVAGGTSVTITGHNFGPAATVMFGSVRATNVVTTSSTSITATSPPGSGTVDVTVTTSRGTSANSPADRFSYQ